MTTTLRFLLPLLVLLAAGCAPPQLQRMEQDLAEMKRRLAASEQALASQRKDQGGSEQLATLNRNMADLKADFDAFRAESLSLSGAVDESKATREDQAAQLAQLRDELAFKVKSIEERLARLESAPAAVPQAAPSPVAAAPDTLYQQGLDAIRNAEDYAKGRELLGKFLRANPKHALAVNAKYWIGEAWYGEKKYENAILQFQDVIQEFGDHPKVASALLKQALSFQALGDQANAKVILQKLIERFPLSDEAKKAKTLL